MNEQLGRLAAGPPVGDATFDAYYFEHCCGKPYRRDEHWLTFFGGIADRIVERIQPRRVLDAGCAIGLLVETLRDRGVEAYGIDLSTYAIANVHEPLRPFCRRASITDELPERYDLIVTIEVLEHLSAADGEAAIANLCRHTDDVLFSSTPLDYRETSHVNVQPPEYWAEAFARHGFFRDIDFDAAFVTPWAARFRRSAEPLPRIVRGYERRYWQLAHETGELRASGAQVQRDLAQALDRLTEAEAARAAAVARARELRDALEETHNHLNRKIAELDRAFESSRSTGAELARTAHDLAHARATIQNMERSVFWRIRGAWARLSRLLGRPT
jgi:SAM-dependent methyltransferase